MLENVKKIGDFDLIVMDELREKYPEKFNESGAMDYKWFEEEILAPIELERNVTAAVQIAARLACEAHHERRRGLAEVLHLEAHAETRLRQRR